MNDNPEQKKKRMALQMESASDQNAGKHDDSTVAFFDLTKAEERTLKAFIDKLHATNSNDVSDGADTHPIISLEKAKDFIQRHPRIISKAIHIINGHPGMLKKIYPKAIDAISNRLADPNGNYYIPPMHAEDPLDPVAALPPVLSVDIVADAILIVGLGGLRGIT